MNADETPLTSPTGGDPRQAERNPVVLRMPVDVRSVALAVIAVLLCLFAMHWAKAVVIPILLGVMTSYALTPAVDLLRRAHVPRAIGAAVVLTSIVAGTAWGAWSLSDQAHALLQSLPQAAQKLRQLTLSTRRDSTSAIAKVEQAAAELEKAAHDSAGTSSRPPARPPAASSWNIKDYLWSGTMGTAVLVGQFAIVLSIALLLLASGDSFRRKMVRLAGPRLSQKKITVQVLDDITGQIQRYLLLQVAFSLIVGLLTWLAFAAIGLEQAAAWGVVAAVTNFIPYLGAAVVGIASTIVALIQFGAIDMGLLVGGTALAIHAVVGNVLTPWLTGKASRIDPFAVLVSLLVFGWLWGVWGLLLGVPVLMVIKAVCDRIEDLKPIGELLGMP